ncbi:MAG: aspartyl/asparaginyl beta-hydroxylase domain-containing protein [Candidatus Eremiobacteraeota bacterium]|nr:aspartyl/asparaginyl beta-hydroxylase domain-containing protein [Candidatus Eremiobacteraeota bacterium]
MSHDLAPGIRYGALPERFATYLGGLASVAQGGGLGPYPGLTAKPWHEPQQFPLVRKLEAQAGAVLRELRGVREADFVPERERIARRGRWDVAFFYERGRPNETLRARCPVTNAAIEGERSVRGPSGLAYLSRLSAASHVAPHRGPTNVRVRCHFGVEIPEDCGLRVGGEIRTWAEGRCIVFDDSFEHEAWNRNVRDRIVLIVDLWHPDLSDEEVNLLAGLDGYVARQAANLAQYYALNRSRG